MLGDQIGEETGQVTGRRVLPTDDGRPVVEVSFRASGTNLGLNQLVVFDGDLVLGKPLSQVLTNQAGARIERRSPAPTATPASSAPAPSVARGPTVPAASSASSPSAVSNTLAARIRGKARIGATNEVNINAIQVAPGQ